jgi:glutaredoxin
VQRDTKALEEMLKVSEGVREVPIIVEDGKVAVGFGGT